MQLPVIWIINIWLPKMPIISDIINIYIFTETNYIICQNSIQFNFPMPLASTAHNIILPLEKVRIRNLLLQSPHCKITSGCWFDEVSVTFVNSNMNEGKHCPIIRMTSVLPSKFILTILEHTNYSKTSHLLINYIHSTFLNVISNIQSTSQNWVFYSVAGQICVNVSPLSKHSTIT